ncbi:hypothetical protein FDECE_7106 [Fusarium decemcellulare]|nr:hypothetical protein FDECE_7106 [Fusarium decemcellulare]
MRWLGLWLDRKLSFKAHIDEWNSKARVISNLLRRIANSQCGPPPDATRKAVKACIEPMLLYGSEAWYPGREIDGKPSRTQHLLYKMHKTYISSLRATAPVWKTTPLPALYRESGFPPIDILIESHRRRFAARLQSLDSAHPLVQYLKPPDRGRATRLQRTAALLPQATRPLLQPRTPRASLRLPDKATAASRFLDWQASLPRRDVIVFSDSSMQDNGVGYGFVIFRGDKLIGTGCEGLRSAEVYDAEVLGALAGLKRALNITTHRVPIHVCLDNNSVIGGLHGRPGESSQQAFLEFRALAKAHGGVRTRWCPGHMGIEGNEVADAVEVPQGIDTSEEHPTPPSSCKNTSWRLRGLPRTLQPRGLGEQLLLQASQERIPHLLLPQSSASQTTTAGTVVAADDPQGNRDQFS